VTRKRTEEPIRIAKISRAAGERRELCKDPPNATVSAFSKDGSVIRDAAVGRVGYGRVGGVGVWHRPYVYRGAWYGGAAVGAAAVGAAAVGAAAASAYYNPYYAPACGYYPYPPCY
jgi:hypothetical protein